MRCPITNLSPPRAYVCNCWKSTCFVCIHRDRRRGQQRYVIMHIPQWKTKTKEISLELIHKYNYVFQTLFVLSREKGLSNWGQHAQNALSTEHCTRLNKISSEHKGDKARPYHLMMENGIQTPSCRACKIYTSVHRSGGQLWCSTGVLRTYVSSTHAKKSWYWFHVCKHM